MGASPSLGQIKALGSTWSSTDDGHRHRVSVILNPDTVVAYFHVKNGHVHAVSVPISQVIAANGVIKGSFDGGHVHTVRLRIQKKTS